MHAGAFHMEIGKVQIFSFDFFGGRRRILPPMMYIWI